MPALLIIMALSAIPIAIMVLFIKFCFSKEVDKKD